MNAAKIPHPHDPISMPDPLPTQESVMVPPPPVDSGTSCESAPIAARENSRAETAIVDAMYADASRSTRALSVAFWFCLM